MYVHIIYIKNYCIKLSVQLVIIFMYMNRVFLFIRSILKCMTDFSDSIVLCSDLYVKLHLLDDKYNNVKRNS